MVSLKRLAGLALAAAAIMAPAAAIAQSAGLPAAQEITPKGALPNVPRNQTLVLGWGVAGGTSIGTTNPWVLPGYTHQEGNNLLFEPLMYFAIFKGEFVPWLADSMEYTTGLQNARDQAQQGRQVERRQAGHVQGRGLHLRRADEV